MIVPVADGSSERLRMFAEELASERLDVLVAVAPSGIAAAREASRTTPIVGVDLEADPVAAGWIASLSRPGGNVTGVFLDMPEFAAKCLQMLMEVVGRQVSIRVLGSPPAAINELRSSQPQLAWALNSSCGKQPRFPTWGPLYTASQLKALQACLSCRHPSSPQTQLR